MLRAPKHVVLAERTHRSKVLTSGQTVGQVLRDAGITDLSKYGGGDELQHLHRPVSGFRAAVEAADVDAMGRALHPDVVFFSPAVFTPYEGREAVLRVLRAVVTVFEDFRYTAQYASGDGEVLRFAARVGDKQVEGVDILTLDADGLVTELVVMVRPIKGLVELVTRMGAALSA